MAKVWLARAGAHGEDEEEALSRGLAIVGFSAVPDLTPATSTDRIIEILSKASPDDAKARVINQARQLSAFRLTIEAGDVVVLPLKTRPGQIALGQVQGGYSYREIAGRERHTRPVSWLRPDVARSIFQQDLLHSFGAFLTVCRIRRNDAEARVAAVLAGNPDPGFEAPEASATSSLSTLSDELDSSALDLPQAAQDEIALYVRRRFPSHDLARLVEAVLKADGFLYTHRSPPGADGGVDILAGRGSLGLDGPALCAQVKATQDAADVTVFRALQGTMSSFKAPQGLLVCWGGFTRSVRTEARQHTFSIRLWDQSDLVQAIYRTYDRLSDEIQAELPLTRIWVLVQEDEDPG